MSQIRWASSDLICILQCVNSACSFFFLFLCLRGFRWMQNHTSRCVWTQRALVLQWETAYASVMSLQPMHRPVRRGVCQSAGDPMTFAVSLTISYDPQILIVPVYHHVCFLAQHFTNISFLCLKSDLGPSGG